jgi:2-polyprenyl-6-methoxyphenol hydroxylase-like FAD-dependent oxidoreductase
MSPAGGVGINLAIQDAIFAANFLSEPLQSGRLTEAALAAVQRRRELPTRIIQGLQVSAHRGFAHIFQNPGPLKAPWPLRVAVRVPGFQRVLGYAIGVGVRPEHVQGSKRTSDRRLLRVAGVIGSALGVMVAILARRKFA